MATEVSASFTLHRQFHNRHRHRHLPFAAGRHPTQYFPIFANPRYSYNISLSTSVSPSPPSSSSSLPNTLTTSSLPTREELENLNFLSNYSYHRQLESGFLWVRVVREEELGMATTLLSECFAESVAMVAIPGYQKILELFVRNYLLARREMIPHNATLLGIYRENGEDDFELAGTVDLTFDRKGAIASPPTPTPHKDSPYISNMAVRKQLRRRGIGWHLLKASEELITKMGSSREIFLHCRMIDEGPFDMYKKAGYTIVETDSILTWITLQRRRHLMRKEIPISDSTVDIDSLSHITNSTEV